MVIVITVASIFLFIDFMLSIPNINDAIVKATPTIWLINSSLFRNMAYFLFTHHSLILFLNKDIKIKKDSEIFANSPELRTSTFLSIDSSI